MQENNPSSFKIILLVKASEIDFFQLSAKQESKKENTSVAVECHLSISRIFFSVLYIFAILERVKKKQKTSKGVFFSSVLTNSSILALEFDPKLSTKKLKGEKLWNVLSFFTFTKEFLG